MKQVTVIACNRGWSGGIATVQQKWCAILRSWSKCGEPWASRYPGRSSSACERTLRDRFRQPPTFVHQILTTAAGVELSLSLPAPGGAGHGQDCQFAANTDSSRSTRRGLNDRSSTWRAQQPDPK
jgi:hypothetical protein